MHPGQLLYAALQADATVAALLGGRIRPNRVEAGAALPAATYQLINQQPVAQLRADCLVPDSARLQLNLYAATYAGIAELATAVRRALRETDFVFQSEGDQYNDAGQIGGRRQDYLIRLSTP